MATVVGHRVGCELSALPARIVAALKQLHIGVPHRFAVIIGDRALNGCIRHQAEYQITGVESGANGNAGEEVVMLIEALGTVTKRAGSQRKLGRGQAGKCESPVPAGLHGSRPLAIAGCSDRHSNARHWLSGQGANDDTGDLVAAWRLGLDRSLRRHSDSHQHREDHARDQFGDSPVRMRSSLTRVVWPGAMVTLVACEI